VVVILGAGALHDPLVAAALRGCGLDAEAAAAPTDASLALGRSLMPRGHPCTVYYLAGAMALHARARPGARCFVTPGDRCGAYASDLARALRDAGVEGATVYAPSPERGLGGLSEALRAARRPVWPAVRDALAAGDVLTAVGAKLRARCGDPGAVDARIDAAARAVARALEAGGDTVEAVRRSAKRLRPWVRRRAPRLRVRVTGELLPAMSCGDPGARLVRWMESRGAEVEAPLASEWAMHQAWRAGRCDVVSARERGRILDAWTRHAAAAGHALAPPVDAAAWVEAAAAWVPPSACSGTGFTEIAVCLEVVRDRRADLVVSLKPFASITSSAVSDAVVHALARAGRVGFLSLEVNGDGHAQMRSRLELAMDFARREPATHGDGREAPR
jgi:predicted nucleotide-binding protein (sugar kinase/HSP70/actin superfamily)